ncbi:MAG: hypothetical protein EOP50_18155 [Sphingobacteriales bacterium]|nr:MAG: hypothetical protein EOP50_18155 [Sphingobacteriales bacterium]
MAEDFNLVLEHLRAIRGDVSELKEGQRRVEQRLTSVERHLAQFHTDMTNQREEMDGMKQRLDRIETRLGLHDPQH